MTSTPPPWPRMPYEPPLVFEAMVLRFRLIQARAGEHTMRLNRERDGHQWHHAVDRSLARLRRRERAWQRRLNYDQCHSIYADDGTVVDE